MWDVDASGSTFTDTGGTAAASTGDPVAHFHAQAGGQNYVEGTLGSQPLLETDGTRKWLQADGSKLMDAAGNPFDPAQAQPFTVILGARIRNGAASTANIFVGALSLPLIGIADAGDYRFGTASGAVLRGGARDANWHCQIGVFNGATSKFLLDGTQIIAGDIGTANLVGATILNGIDGDLNCLYIINGVPDNDHLAGYNAFVRAKLGL